MEKTKKHPRFYTLGEEIANAITHGLGAALAIAGAVVMIVCAAQAADPWKIVSACIYGFGLILLFTMSTLYHSFPVGKTKSVFRVFDHASISLLIAGTYTPICLVTIRGWVGWTIFGIAWGCAALSITLNSINLEKFDKLTLVGYLVSGWCIVMALPAVIKAMPLPGLLLMLTGGLCYTFGVIFYKKKNKYMHAIWHIFVLAAGIFHFFAVLLYVIL